jgi:class 3 adenylate cyclase/tetratricopeptide (TPR) repeat protein
MSRPTCERCARSVPEGARYCPNCGFPVGAPAPEERKVVTIVFVDLVGSTMLSAKIDPERYREVLATYYAAVAEEFESLRGRAENFAGDAVVGAFGIPRAHDDDALRAVRAALAITERVGRIGESLALPGPLACRVGVNTGPVAIGSGSERGLLFGAVVNAAARLEQAAEPGTVLVGDTTRLLTAKSVRYGDRIEVRAKGFEGTLPAWPVVGLAPRSSRRTIPFVDRRRELRLLGDTLERVRETRRGHMVTLFGEPGIGKSRLAAEFLAGLPEKTKVLTGRADPFEEDVTFAPVAQILLQAIGERSDAPPDRLIRGLETLARSCLLEDEVGEVVARLGIVLGLAEEPKGGRRYRVAEIRDGLLSILAGIATPDPVVLVLEDLHHAQPPLLDLVEQVVREAKRTPLLLLCMSRSELLDERPRWGGGRGDSLNLYLEPMSPPDATELALEAGEGLDEATAERIAQHAGGNPFFIVETTGMLLHGGAELPSGAEPVPERLLPPTVQAVIAARIDALGERPRELLRKASVFARSSFDLSELALIAEPDADALAELEDEELLARDERRPDVWRFQHGIVRDVAYASLPKRERRRLHLRLVEGFSRPENAERYPRSIAYHLEQAARAGLDLDPRDRTIAERAVDALAHAGDLALDASDARAAEDLYERALALAGPERSFGVREAAVLSNLGEARYWLGEFGSAAGPLARALELAGGDPRIRAHANRFLGDIELSVHGDRARAAERIGDALAAARQLGDPWTLARALLSAGWVPYWRDDFEAARALFEEALAVTRSNPEADRWAEARALGMLAMLESEIGDEERASSLASEALAIAEASGDRFSVGVAHQGVGDALRRLWRLEEAGPHLDVAVEAMRELETRWELASSLTSRGILRRLSRRSGEAVKDLREAFRICRDLKERSILAWTASALAQASVDAGDLETAREALLEAAAVGAESPSSRAWLAAAEVVLLLAEGERDAARERAMDVLRLYEERGRRKDLAQRRWWNARVFGPDAAGGVEEMDRARELLEALHWEQALREPDLVEG